MKPLNGIFKIAIFMVLIGCTSVYASHKLNVESTKKTIHLKSADGLDITADLYEVENENKPIILLFHQAGYSRGEYLSIAPKLNDLGYTCMAIDQRSGKGINGIENETYLRAKKNGLGTDYLNALPDLEAALVYAKENYSDRKLIIWGSSYSASLVFILGSSHKESISAIVAFSPGEYFKFQGKEIQDFAKEIECPVFITSSKDEYESRTAIFESIASKNKSYFVPELAGYHGSKALWENKEGNEAYWDAIIKFLQNVKD